MAQQQAEPIQQQQQQQPVEQLILQKIKDNAYGILFQTPNHPKLVQLIAGNKIQTSDGAAFRHLNFINQPWTSKVQAFNKPGKYQRAIKPKSTLITQTLARKTQILYSMDNSAIVFKLNLIPGCVVIQAGTGSGSLSCAIAQTITQTGHLFTFQFNQQRAEITKKFFSDLQLKQITSTWRDVVSQGFSLNAQQLNADALFLDVPNPWAAISHAKRALKQYGRICCFSPCIQQVQKTVSELRKQKFAKIQSVECLSRQFQMGQKLIQQQGLTQGKRSLMTTPVHSNRGHTGYLTFAINF